MVDSASCAVADLTGGFWSALLPQNPLKQPYTKPKSSFIWRKCALFLATAPVKQWQSHWSDIHFPYVLAHAGVWMCHWIYIFRSRLTNIPVIWVTSTTHKPQSPPGTWICMSKMTWESLLTEGYPLNCSWGGVSHGFFQHWLTNCTVSGTQAPLPTQKPQLLVSKKRFLVLHLPSLLTPLWAIALHQHCLGFHSEQKHHWISLGSSWPCLSFCLSFFEHHCRIQLAFRQIPFHSIPLAILPVTFLSRSKSSWVIFHIKF